MDRISPLLEIALGTVPLLATLFVHGAGMSIVQWRSRRRRADPHYSRFGADVYFASMILVMLITHLLEVFLWAGVLIWFDAIPVFRDAFYYVAGTYTTLGYGEGTLPREWRLLAPMIAISGLFAFGWTTGVLFNLVTQSYQEKEAAKKERAD